MDVPCIHYYNFIFYIVKFIDHVDFFYSSNISIQTVCLNKSGTADANILFLLSCLNMIGRSNTPYNVLY